MYRYPKGCNTFVVSSPRHYWPRPVRFYSYVQRVSITLKFLSLSFTFSRWRRTSPVLPGPSTGPLHLVVAALRQLLAAVFPLAASASIVSVLGWLLVG